MLTNVTSQEAAPDPRTGTSGVRWSKGRGSWPPTLLLFVPSGQNAASDSSASCLVKEGRKEGKKLCCSGLRHRPGLPVHLLIDLAVDDGL